MKEYSLQLMHERESLGIFFRGWRRQQRDKDLRNKFVRLHNQILKMYAQTCATLMIQSYSMRVCFTIGFYAHIEVLGETSTSLGHSSREDSRETQETVNSRREIYWLDIRRQPLNNASLFFFPSEYTFHLICVERDNNTSFVH